MNSRIKELVAQSTTDSSGKWLSLEDAERLVETIIKECAQIAEQAHEHIKTDGGKRIKQHFEITE